jgi:hypothetical protein
MSVLTGLLNLAEELSGLSVKQLVDKGYPEEVAQKIASGELPMDPASIAARQAQMGMTDPTYYRGHSSAKPPTSNDDMFVARDRRDIAETYASGGEAYDEATDSYITLPGEVTPLRTNASKFIEADGMGDDWTYPTVNVPGVGRSYGTDEIARNVKRSREIQGNGLQGSLFTDVRDDIGGDLPPGDVANILGSQPEVKIRHADRAAYDPDYSGPNIMGFAQSAGNAGQNTVSGFLSNTSSIEETMGQAASQGLEGLGMDPETAAFWGPIAAIAPQFVPLVGAGVGIDNTVRALDKGNYGEAALEAGLTVLGEVPIFGDLAAKGIKSVIGRGGDAAEELPNGVLGITGEKVTTRTVGEEIPTEVYDPLKVEKGVVKPYSQNPVLANIDMDGPRPDNIASGQWKKKQRQMEDPVIRAREEARPAGGMAVGTDNLEAELISYEDLARERTPMVWLPADGTMVSDVVQVGGRQIKPVAANGGPLHADKYGAWMSMNGAAANKQRHAQRVLAETGESPMYVHLNMGNEGSNFSHMPSEIWTNYVDEYPMYGEGWDVLNARMSKLKDADDTKGVSADWIEAGVDSPEGLRGFLLPQYGAEAAESTLGNRRKIFMNTVAKAGVQDAGGPIVNDIYSSLLEPGLLGQQGMAGYRAMRSVDADPGGLLMNLDRHPSYDTIIPGNGVYTFKEGTVPGEIMFPDAFASPKRADKLPHERFRSVQTNGTEYQIADQQWLDGIMSYLESVNR